MTAAVYRSTPSLSVPQSQNTAPVLEFNCLFTHDVRKKQKKWHDGFLRYHTFNKRAMVYDVSRNLIGDCHWTGDDAVQEGVELRLERNGVMVEVSDKIGQTETDLTELRKSTKKNKDAAAAGAGDTPVITRPTPSARTFEASASVRSVGHQKHRSLGALLGTPKGMIGKAVMPQKSPFEERQAALAQENEEWEDGRPAKRRRTAATSDWNVTSKSKAGKPTKATETPLWARKADAAKKQKPSSRGAGQRQLPSKEVITLSDDNDDATDSSKTFLPGFSDDALAPSSPVRDKRMQGFRAATGSSSPVFQTQRPPHPSRLSTTTADQARPETNRIQDPSGHDRRKEAARSRSPEIQHAPEPSRHSTTTKDQVRSKTRRVEDLVGDMLPPVNKGVRARENPGQRAMAVLHAPETPQPVADRPTSAINRPGQVLRLASGGPKKSTLLCRTQISKEPKRTPSTNVDTSRSRTPEAKSGERETGSMSSRAKLEARLAKIDAQGGSTSLQRLKKPKATSPLLDIDDNSGFSQVGDPTEGCDNDLQQQSAYERSVIELRKLNAMMLPPSVGPSARSASPRERTPGPFGPQEDRPIQQAVEVRAPLPQPRNTLTDRNERSRPREDPSPPAAAAETQRLRRVASESTAAAQPGNPTREPGVPVRYTPTPSPSKPSRQATPKPTVTTGKEPDTSNNSKQAPTTSKTKSKRPLQKSVSLNMTSNGTSKVLLSRPFNAPRKAASSTDQEPEPPQDQGPWSREAFDLFLWRPPNWNEEEWCVKEVKEASGGRHAGLSGGVSAPHLS